MIDFMKIRLTLSRPFVWLCRIRHRCGYGVHSPFAFNLITGVIYEHSPYYKYTELKKQEKSLAREKGQGWARMHSLKLKRLLFRLVNHVGPATVIDFGPASSASLYLKAGSERADYTAAAGLDELFLESGVAVDFLFLHDFRHPDSVEEAFRVCAERVGRQSLFVVEGIGYTPPMRALWKRMKQDGRVAVTFDLYDVGLLFFDHSKNRQDYIVNF